MGRLLLLPLHLVEIIWKYIHADVQRIEMRMRNDYKRENDVQMLTNKTYLHWNSEKIQLKKSFKETI